MLGRPKEPAWRGPGSSMEDMGTPRQLPACGLLLSTLGKALISDHEVHTSVDQEDLSGSRDLGDGGVVGKRARRRHEP